MLSARHLAGITAGFLCLGTAAFGAVASAKVEPTQSAGPPSTAATAGNGAPVSIPISGRDRVYTADQTSNTVTVIDPSTNRTLGTIALGAQRLGASFSPQYLDNTGVHGLAYTRDHKRLGVVSVTSNTVTVIETATNKVLNQTDVGRAAHEGTFTADGKEFWVANRGRDTVTISDAERGGVLANLPVGAGPSKVLLSPDGKLAYVNHIKLAEITVIDVAARKVVDHITGLGSTFSSDQAISPDGKELWASHKAFGKISVVDLVNRKVSTVLSTGPDTNHPAFADTAKGSFAYLTVGGLDKTVVYRRTASGVPELVTEIRNNGHAPHGIWASGDSTRVYVGLEKSDKVDVIDTATNKVTSTIGVGQEPQALVYVPEAAPAGSAPGLGKQGLGGTPKTVDTVLPNGRPGDPQRPENKGRVLEATVRQVSGLDMIQLQARDLQPTNTYQAFSVDRWGRRTPIVSFTTDASGSAPQVLAFADFRGQRIAIESKGKATQQTLAAAVSKSSHHGSEGSGGTGGSGGSDNSDAPDGRVETADLLYCDCC